MSAILGLTVGFILALLLIYIARKFPPERKFYAIGLVVAALIYVVFAVVGGASAGWLMLEGVGLLIYGLVAWFGLRSWPPLLAFGWAAHVAWDVLFHLSGAGAEYTPDWYPWTCVSFDLVIAAAITISFRRST